MPNFTLVLSDEDAARVRDLLKYFGGSVGGFGATIVSDLSHLDPNEIVNVRQQIATLAESAKARRRQSQSRIA